MTAPLSDLSDLPEGAPPRRQRMREILRTALDARGWTIAEFQRQLEEFGGPASRQGVHHWLRGHAEPQGEILPHIARLLDFDAETAAEFYASAGSPLPAVIEACLGAAGGASTGAA